MAYNYEYPYTDPNRYNDDWLLNKMKELEGRLDGIVEETLALTKKAIVLQAVCLVMFSVT